MARASDGNLSVAVVYIRVSDDASHGWLWPVSDVAIPIPRVASQYDAQLP